MQRKQLAFNRYVHEYISALLPLILIIIPIERWRSHKTFYHFTKFIVKKLSFYHFAKSSICSFDNKAFKSHIYVHPDRCIDVVKKTSVPIFNKKNTLFYDVQKETLKFDVFLRIF